MQTITSKTLNMTTSQFLRVLSSGEADRPFGQIPADVRVNPHPCEISIPPSEIAGLRSLVQKARLGPVTFENSQAETNRQFGLTRSWMSEAVKTWTSESAFNWSVSAVYMPW